MQWTNLHGRTNRPPLEGVLAGEGRVNSGSAPHRIPSTPAEKAAGYLQHPLRDNPYEVIPLPTELYHPPFL